MLFRSADEKNNLASLLAERIADVDAQLKPTEEAILGIAGRMAMDFNALELLHLHTQLSTMLVQHAMGALKQACHLAYRRGNDISGVISRWRQCRTAG